MKKILCTLTLAFFCLLLAPQQAQAQYYCSYGVAYGASWTWQSGSSVYFYSSTELDYCAGLYYDPATWGRYSEGNWATENVRMLGEGYTEGYADWIPAEIYASYAYPYHRQYYNTDTRHYVLEYYQQYYCFYYCGYYWYDPWGWGFAEGGGYGGPSWYGYGGAGYWEVRRRRLGDTWHTIQYISSQCQAGHQFAENGTSCPNPTPTPNPTPNPADPQVTVKSVGFKNDWDVKQYVNGEASDPVIAPGNEPTWVSGRDNTGFVVAYTKGASPTAFMTFTVSSAAADTPAKLRVKNGDTVMTTFDINVSSNGDVFLTDISLPAQLGETPHVARAKDYTFRWEYSINGGSWRGAGITTQKIYWTMANPIADPFTNTRGRVHGGLYDLALEKSVGALGEGTADPDAAMSTITTAVAGELFYRPSRPNDPAPGTHPLSVYTRPSKDYQCNDNAQLLRGLFRSAGMDGTFNFYWGGNPSNGVAHWYIQPGTSPDPAFGRTNGENTTARFVRPALMPEGLAANPYFTFHATVTASTPTSTRSYDASYGIVEPEVKIMQAVNSSGACVNGEAANAWRVKSPTWMTLARDFGYACGVTASTGGTGIPRAASVVSQSVPTFMEAGAGYWVSVTMQNNGDNTWTDADLYRLGAQNPHDNWTWGLNRAPLPRSVAPGEQVTIEFYVTAPSYPGYYNFQWRMVQDGVEWFGDHTPNVQVEVYSLNTCDPWQEQDCWNRGGSWDSNSCYCYGGWYYY